MSQVVILRNGIEYDKIPDFKIGDFGTVLTFYIRKDNGAIYPLTGMTVKFISKIDNYTNTSSYFLDKSCTVTNAAGGICTLTLADGDLNDEGSYDSYLKIYSASFEEKIPLGFLNIFGE